MKSWDRYDVSWRKFTGNFLGNQPTR